MQASNSHGCNHIWGKGTEGVSWRRGRWEFGFEICVLFEGLVIAFGKNYVSKWLESMEVQCRWTGHFVLRCVDVMLMLLM